MEQVTTGGAMGQASSDDDDGEHAPSGIERRMVLRLLSYWRELRGDGNLPSFDDLDPARIPDIWEHAFVLDIFGCADDPVFRAVGATFAAHAPGPLEDTRVSEAPRDTLVEMSVEYVQEAIAREVPISRGGEFIKPDGVKVLYRSIIVPMSDDGETVSGLFGAANCREIAAGE